jgi:hypothetical protein
LGPCNTCSLASPDSPYMWISAEGIWRLDHPARDTRLANRLTDFCPVGSLLFDQRVSSHRYRTCGRFPRTPWANVGTLKAHDFASSFANSDAITNNRACDLRLN